jgi:AcrR family transcriptional regulator
MRAGYTPEAFYSNFASLDELFLALYTDPAAALIQAVAAAVTAALSDLGLAGETARLPLAAVVDGAVAALPVSREHHLLNTEFAVHALRHPDVGEALAAERSALREALIPGLRMALGGKGAAASTEQLDDVARRGDSCPGRAGPAGTAGAWQSGAGPAAPGGPVGSCCCHRRAVTRLSARGARRSAGQRP